MFKILKKTDILLIAAIVVTGILMSVFLVFGQTEGSTLKVTVYGKVYGTYPLNEDTSVTVNTGNHINTFEIKDKKVSMTHANCYGHDCVMENEISMHGQTIVCLPHKMVLEITGDQPQLDVVVQ